MTALGRQVAVTAALILVFWAALEHSLCGLAVMRNYIHTDYQTGRVPQVHDNQGAQLVADLHLLARTDRPKIIVLGASTAQDGFQPAQLAALFPGYEVHGMAQSGGAGGATIHGNMRVMAAAREAMSPAAREKSVFVYGASIELFNTSTFQYEGNSFDDARSLMFPRLYRRTAGGTEMRFGRAITMAALRFMRPFFALRKVVPALQWGSRPEKWAFLSGNAGNGVHVRSMGTDGSAREPDDPGKIRLQSELLRANPLVAERQPLNPRLREYGEMLAHADRNGINFVVAVLPHRRSLMREHPFYAEFIGRLRRGVEDNSASGTVKFVDMSDLLGNGAFRDSHHVVAGAAPHCAYALWKNWPF